HIDGTRALRAAGRSRVIVRTPARSSTRRWSEAGALIGGSYPRRSRGGSLEALGQLHRHDPPLPRREGELLVVRVVRGMANLEPVATGREAHAARDLADLGDEPLVDPERGVADRAADRDGRGRWPCGRPRRS